MRIRSLVLAALALLTLWVPVAHGAQPGAASQKTAAAPPDRALLDKFCVGCHNTKRRVAGLELESVDPARAEASAAVWEKVVRKLRSGAMPPVGMPRPERAASLALAEAVEASLDRAAAATPNPGRSVPHRLNRVEYANAIRDLLAVRVDAEALLPSDESGFGFDNIADVLSLSPALLERYMLAAWKISRLAVGDPEMGSTTSMYRFPVPLVQDERMSEDLPFQSRGGAAIEHDFPLDGEYSIRLRLHRTWTSPVIRGLANREQVDLRLDGQRLRLFAVGGECVGSTEARCVRPPGIIPASEYERNADADLVVRVPVHAGTHRIGAAFLARFAKAAEGTAPARQPAAHPTFLYAEDVNMSIESVEVIGPLAGAAPGRTPSRARIFTCAPRTPADAPACARQILSTLSRRAYRRPATSPEVETLMAFFRQGSEGATFERGIQLAIERLLVSPDFLFRVERDPAGSAAGSVYRISNLELASRLSFLVWSSIPDDELLDVAVRGRLRDPVVLAAQVRRMLRDEKAGALVSNFFGQWLYLRNIDTVAPDPEAFPEFDEGLRAAFKAETELFLRSQLSEDRGVDELLTARYTFVNERLARHYGIRGIYGPHFRRVPLADEARGGLLGQGAILTITSYATRTSPVVRGKWLLENLLAAPPPPPPPNVPALKEGKDEATPTSVRERLEQHRRNPVCAGCHARMDPLGFALENFDAIGKWRTHDALVPIDASGVLPDGTKFAGPAAFRQALVAHREELVRATAEKLLTYAVGRGLEHTDEPALRRILRESSAGGDRWSALLLAVVKSDPFQKRVSARAATPSQRVSR
jgi:hypothetical protein